MPTIETILFQEDFEAGNYAKWDYVNVGDPGFAINSNLAYVKTGAKSSAVHFSFTGPDSQDLAMLKDFTGNGLEEFWIRAWVYLKTPAGALNILNRKLIFISDDKGGGGYNWSLFLWGAPSAGTNILSFSINDNTYVVAFTYSDLFTLLYDTWYELVLHVKLDHGVLADGIIQVWVNGTKVLDVVHAIRGSFTTGAAWFGVGKQASAGAVTVDEWRYFDDVKIYTLADVSSALRRRRRLRRMLGEL